MPRSINDVVDEMNELLRKSGEPIATITWPQFYTLNVAERLKQPRLDEIQVNAKARYQLIVGYGASVVLVAHDRNFSPPPI